VAAGRPRGWKAYDEVADVYENSAAPLFRRLADDLVSLVAPGAGSRVLDLGTGTGFAAGAASRFVGSSGVVVGVDPSLPMLEIARQRSGCLVAGMAPILPFAAGSFEVVLANLVLSHFPKLDVALSDVMQILGPGGRLGASAWAESNAAPEDDGVVAGAIVTATLQGLGLATRPPASGAPSEQWLMVEGNLRAALVRARLVEVIVEERSYVDEAPVERYVRELDWFGLGRYLRTVIDEDTRTRFRHEVRTQLAERFPDGIRRTHLLRLAVGVKRA
jgi:SAM-dependent methyltransferase